ncbi:MAG TPA: M23 family metallopeptidase, partial [Cytophagaceae bacterium]
MRLEKIWLLFFLFVSAQLYAQDTKKKGKDFLNIKAPSIKYSSLDTSEVLFEEEFRSNSKINNYEFDPGKERSLVEEDTNSFSDEDLSIVEVSEQLSFDSVWVTIAEYFAIWDSRTINPYKKDGSKFDDTLSIALYDSLSGFNWSMPLSLCASTSEFGMRHTRWHYGIDLDLETGDPVLATFDGIVRISHNDPGGYGNYVLLRHYNGLETLYGHLTRPEVQIGQLVKAGDMIGLGGNTGRSSGSHLHFEVRYEGHAINPEHLY